MNKRPPDAAPLRLSPLSLPGLLLLALTLLLLAGCKTRAGGEEQLVEPGTNPPGIVAYVGARPISEAQWRQARAYAAATLRLLGEPGAELDEAAALESFVEDTLIAREADAAGFDIEDNIVAAEESRLLQVAGKTQEDLAQILAEVGLSPLAWRAELHRAIRAGAYLDEVALKEAPPGKKAQMRADWLASKKKEIGVQIFADFEPIEGLSIGDAAPDFEVIGMDGEALRLSDLRGHPVALNFWATWCSPCRQEMPLFQQVYTANEEKGLVILAVNVGEEEALVRQFIEDMGVTFVMARDPDQLVTRQYRIFGLPTTFFITAEGVINYVVAGAIREKDLTTQVKALLQEDAPNEK